ncbi:hypothetical protein F383_24286 [Gossypium arboreum]|uniref:Uncharacterized protein n=1 Tax=Gossypium arboreum TaxID=29729 RepID=A0A0B0P2G0_GOSAR|nr:hypothetical protein F383_24286 [Gossypium arboreum]
MMNLASEMDQSVFLEQFPASLSVFPFPPPLGCIYRLWNA